MTEEHKQECCGKETAGMTKTSTTTKIMAVVVGVLLLIIIYNGFRLNSLSKQINDDTNNIGNNANIDLTAFASIIPKGVPLVYGAELGVSYDDVSTINLRKAEDTINKLGSLDNAISLSGDQLKRYVGVALKMSCEYCCGAESIIFSNGQAACGCAHSYAMRGLAKYLIKNHGDEFSDNQILGEVGKWKVLFFPGVHMQKATALKARGLEVNYVNLASNLYRGIEKGIQAATGDSMVGGC